MKRARSESPIHLSGSSEEDDIPLAARKRRILEKKKESKKPEEAKAASANSTIKLEKTCIQNDDFMVTEAKTELLWIVTPKDAKPSPKIAAFDLDFTIVVPKTLMKNGKPARFPKDRADWRLWHSMVPKKLTKLHSEGYRIVIFTNQAGVQTGKTNVADVYGKIQDISKKINVPLSAVIVGAKNRWRKPNPDVWEYFVQDYNNGQCDMSQCFYVGDAAGRPKNWTKGKSRDFSVSDRKFAHNLGLKFHTPENFFFKMHECSAWEWRSTVPKDFLKKQAAKPRYEPSEPKFPEGLNVVLMCAYPASGKSTFCRKNLVPRGFVVVNRDTLKTASKCKKAMKESLAEKKSVVIDNTNPTMNVRKQFIDIAKSFGANVTCLWLKLEKEEAEHINAYRRKVEPEVPHVPTIAFNVFRKNFQPPDKEKEGINEVCIVNWKPDFASEEHKKLFLQFN